MVLTHKDQMNLIRDILSTHHLDGAAHLSEFQQLSRSTESLMTGQALPTLNDTFQAINSYSEQGINLETYDDHLKDNKENFQAWLDTI